MNAQLVPTLCSAPGKCSSTTWKSNGPGLKAVVAAGLAYRALVSHVCEMPWKARSFSLLPAPSHGIVYACCYWEAGPWTTKGL